MVCASEENKINIRQVHENDLSDIAKVFEDAYNTENTGESWTYETALEVVEYWYARAPKDLQVVAEIDGKIIGSFFVDVKPWWDGYRMIDGEFFVLTEMQKLGAGKKMFVELVDIARTKYRCKCFETITFMPENEHPLKWYKKMGFKIDKSLVVINVDLEKLGVNLTEDC